MVWREDLKGGIWMVWVGVGLNASLSSFGYHWAVGQAASLLFFAGWAYYNVALSKFIWGLLLMVVGIFFRHFDVAGAQRIPKTGPVMLACAPHASQFVDPLVVMRALKHRADIGFLTAAKTMRRKWVGKAARAMNAIPVERAQDLAKRGAGRASADGTKFSGEGTRFLKEVAARDTIHLSVATGATVTVYQARVASVESDTALTLVAPGLRSDGGAPPASPIVSAEYQIYPHVDQSKVFDDVTRRLLSGGAVGIFPEGGSHDRTQLLELKAGVAIMALEAMAASPDLPLTIVPVGLNYFQGHRFRSRVFVDVGEPVVPSPEMVEKYKAGGASRRAACSELLERVHDGIRSVTVEAPDFATLQFFRAVRRLYTPVTNRGPDAAGRFALMKSFAVAYEKTKDEPEVKQLYNNILRYRNLLSDTGIPDHKVAKAELDNEDDLLDKALLATDLVYNVVLLIFFSFFIVPGVVLAGPVLLVARHVSTREASKALKGSSVKVAARDVLATWKLMVSLVFVPLIHNIYTFLAYYFLSESAAVTYFFFAPFVCGIFIVCVEEGKQRFALVRALMMALLQDEQGAVLVKMRRNLKVEAQAVVQKFSWDVAVDNEACRRLRECCETEDGYDPVAFGLDDLSNLASPNERYVKED